MLTHLFCVLRHRVSPFHNQIVYLRETFCTKYKVSILFYVRLCTVLNPNAVFAGVFATDRWSAVLGRQHALHIASMRGAVCR